MEEVKPFFKGKLAVLVDVVELFVVFVREVVVLIFLRRRLSPLPESLLWCAPMLCCFVGVYCVLTVLWFPTVK